MRQPYRDCSLRRFQRNCSSTLHHGKHYRSQHSPVIIIGESNEPHEQNPSIGMPLTPNHKQSSGSPRQSLRLFSFGPLYGDEEWERADRGAATSPYSSTQYMGGI